MTLHAIHDFECELLNPCLAMTTRGIRIDEPRRVAMLAELRDARGPLEVEASAYVTQVVLPANAARLNADKAHLFREWRVCVCCRNGKAKRAACWECSGFAKKPGKREADAATVPLAPCRVCSGAGASESVTFNPASPEQVRIVLYELLRLPARTKDGKLTADERALKSLLAECDAKPEAKALIQQLLRLGKLDTIASILERIAPGEDGRIRTVYNPAGTETGRFTSSESFLVKSTNLSNLPKREATEPLFDVKRCFIPDDGCVFVEADLAGAEAWVTAAACGDTALLTQMRSGIDLHKWTASRIFNKTVETITSQERHLGKTARHALNYGMQWKTFMEEVNEIADRTGVAITAARAKQICTGYHALHPRLEMWWRAVQGWVIGNKHKLATCFGRTRTFYGRNPGEYLGVTHREMIAQESQSTIADLLNRGLLRWWRQHDGRVGILLAQVYDSVLIQCKREHAALCAALVRRCLTEEITVYGIRITVPVDVKVLESWAVQPEAKAA